jgi:uncharacterized protein YdhG (YjbR/CyaY superfamily)
MKKGQKVPETIDEYIARFPKDVQAILEKVRTTIRKAAPGAEEKISYRMPAFAFKGILVYFAAHQKHIGFYPTSTGIAEFKKELSAYEGGKGSVQFPFDKPIPYDLIGKIVKFRVKRKPGKSPGERGQEIANAVTSYRRPASSVKKDDRQF